MDVVDLGLEGVILLKPRVHADERGWFFESYRQYELDRLGLPPFVQGNQSRSARDVLRGLHYQLRRPQAKLVRAVRGQVLDVVADIRRGSPTFGKHVTVELSEDRPEWLYVPVDYAHGFCVLSEVADVEYRCSDYYDPGDQRGIIWDDPTLHVAWPTAAPRLSPKDAVLQPLSVERDDLPAYRR